MSSISRDEWLAALGEADVPVDPHALTITEFATLMGMGRQAAASRMTALERAGKAVCVRKIVACRDGRPMRVRAYRLVTSGKKK